MIKDKLIVSETFYSIQGEGPTSGIPSVFLRLAGCNLLCDGKWICDTIEVWKHGKSREFDLVLSPDLLAQLKKGAHLVITGGEPLLQQDAILEYIYWLHDKEYYPYIEIETNGTVYPKRMLVRQVHQFNVSPKLSNSGEDSEKRINEIAIAGLMNSPGKTYFKFVINTHEDYFELCDTFPMIKNNIVLMPAGGTQEELNQTRLEVIELCKATGHQYSERLHIVAWNKKTGV